MSKRAATDLAASSTKKAKSAAITSFFKKDGVTQSSTPRAAAEPVKPFDKSAWLESLSQKHRDLLRLEIESMDETWLSVLHQEFTKPYFLKLKEFVARERASQTVFPPEKDVYSWSRHTPFDHVKVVIIGQDPYHNENQAHGLCFSVQAPCPPPPSLKNIYKGLKNDYPTFRVPRHGSLLSWADQGVLLLNTCLTVRAHQANSHQKQGWEQFTQRVLDSVAAHREKGVVFMAWGKPASERVKAVDTKKHLKLESVHPSPLSAARGFFECRHFVKANDWLTSHYGIEQVIRWDSLADDGGQKAVEKAAAARIVPRAPTEADEVGQIAPDKGTAPSLSSSLGASRGLPADLKAEDSFGVSREEEDLMAAAQDEAEHAERDLQRKSSQQHEEDQVEQSTRAGNGSVVPDPTSSSSTTKAEEGEDENSP